MSSELYGKDEEHHHALSMLSNNVKQVAHFHGETGQTREYQMWKQKLHFETIKNLHLFGAGNLNMVDLPGNPKLYFLNCE